MNTLLIFSFSTLTSVILNEVFIFSCNAGISQLTQILNHSSSLDYSNFLYLGFPAAVFNSYSSFIRSVITHLLVKGHFAFSGALD